MAASVTDICNAALIELGQEPVTSVFPPDSNKRAMLCSVRYDEVRRALLEAATWVCARGRAQLASAESAPPFGFPYVYQLPADFIRMVRIDDDEYWSWIVESNQLLTDVDPPANIIYIRDLTDTTIMSPMFRRTLGLELALDLCPALTQSGEKFKLVQAKLEDQRARARTAERVPRARC